MLNLLLPLFIEHLVVVARKLLADVDVLQNSELFYAGDAVSRNVQNVDVPQHSERQNALDFVVVELNYLDAGEDPQEINVADLVLPQIYLLKVLQPAQWRRVLNLVSFEIDVDHELEALHKVDVGDLVVAQVNSFQQR